MKLELKTENENSSKSILSFFKIFFISFIIIILCDAIFKLKIISRNFQIDYNCRILSVEKSTSNFKKLSRIIDLKGKQRIWEFCREFIK